MTILGLIGGIGSGKSTVAEMFRQCGAVVVNADRIGHELLCRRDIMDTLTGRWGDSILNENGDLSRAVIARIVFQPNETGKAERQFLDALLHPLIHHEMSSTIQALKRMGEKLILIDAPLLLEAGWDDQVDRIIFIDAPREVRWERVRQRGWTEAEFDAREAAQWPIEEKRRRADNLVDNSKNLEKTLDQIKLFCKNG